MFLVMFLALQPDLQPNVDLGVLTLIAALNPAVSGVGLWLGRQCDQPQKILIAGFAAGLAGMALIWLAAILRMPFIYEPGRAAAGIFVVQALFGMAWAAIGWRFLRRQ
jgi:NO-binding membrane sensor protein with MHYT domain